MKLVLLEFQLQLKPKIIQNNQMPLQINQKTQLKTIQESLTIQIKQHTEEGHIQLKKFH